MINVSLYAPDHTINERPVQIIKQKNLMTVNRRLITNTLLLFIPLFFSTKLHAQSNLMKQISIGELKQQPMASVLNKIASKENFYFAYNNKIVPADSLVSVSGYRGTLFSLLEKLLGENYEFKEVPGYVVLRYAPRKLFITAEVGKDQGKQTVVKGYVNNVADQKEVAQASVYEKNLLISTLTDDNGYFELKLKNYTGSIVLTVSKENYRDTSVYVLPVVLVNEKRTNSGKNYKYYPDGNPDAGVEHSRFARFFISSKQMVQGLNLGNFFASSPYQVSLIPGLSTQGMYNSQVIDHFSLNILGGYTAGIDGIEMAGIFNINRKDMQFLQVAGIFNFVGGSVKGIQMAGIYNSVLNDVFGLQVAGIANRANHFTGGMQMAGLANIDKQVAGFQVAGLMNIYGSGKGIAIANIANIAKDSSGTQIAGLMNKGGNVSGLQLSTFMNTAQKVKGVQFGLINIADSSDYPIGIINFIKNGEKSIGISTDESAFAHVDLRSGGRVLYGLFGIGYKPGTEKIKYALDLGFGVHILNHKKFFLNAEYVAALTTDMDKTLYQTSSFKLLPGYKFDKHWGLFAGPSINLTSTDTGDDVKIHGWVLGRSVTDNHINTSFTGITGGVQYAW